MFSLPCVTTGVPGRMLPDVTEIQSPTSVPTLTATSMLTMPPCSDGMTTATLLTLLVVPVFYTFFDDLREVITTAARRALAKKGTLSFS